MTTLTATSQESYINCSVNSPQFPQLVLRKVNSRLHPGKWPSSWKRGGRKSDGISMRIVLRQQQYAYLAQDLAWYILYVEYNGQQDGFCIVQDSLSTFPCFPACQTWRWNADALAPSLALQKFMTSNTKQCYSSGNNRLIYETTAKNSNIRPSAA